MLIAALFERTATETAFILAAAVLLDAVIGDPDWLYRRLPHPIALLGRLIGAGERALNCGGPTTRFISGTALSLATIFLAGAIGYGLAEALPATGWGIVVETLVVAVLLAGRSLHEHVAAVADGLADGLERGRGAIRHLVGRDPESLDEAGVGRAAVESLAENFSDGLVAPVFWYALFGLPGICAYKAMNTLDSMIAHRNERHEWFGKTAARLDDAANWIPARLAALSIVAAAQFHKASSSAGAWRAMWRDAHRHRSPNAGWAEAAMAGALGLKLAGPRSYAGLTVADAWMGEGRADLGSSDIRRALRLYSRAWILTGLVVLAVGHLLLAFRSAGGL